MKGIQAIGFDLFNTLITFEQGSLGDAMDRLTASLRKGGLVFEDESFKRAHRDAAIRFIEQTRADGRETHNRFWISAALDSQGYAIEPDDPLIAEAVQAYFSSFVDHFQLVPGTVEMLQTLEGRYRIGLLSNLTDGPAGRRIIEKAGLSRFFEVMLISGELGYRKPHPIVFERLVEGLGVEAGRILFVGDDLESDIHGARSSGLRPVWSSYVRDRELKAVGRPVHETAGLPDESVPRISTWQDLLALLDRRG